MPLRILTSWRMPSLCLARDFMQLATGNGHRTTWEGAWLINSTRPDRLQRAQMQMQPQRRHILENVAQSSFCRRVLSLRACAR